MAVVSRVKRDLFKSSVQLMYITKQLSSLRGVQFCSVMMGTENNKTMLREVELLTAEVEQASANDLFVVVQAETTKVAEEALSFVDAALSSVEPVTMRSSPDISTAIGALPDANLALISVPGHLAAAQARQSLESGLHVHLFSDNVSLEDEVELKRLARSKGLLMMGPGCGTALINGVSLAFANRVKRGPIGIVSAAGTGLQEVSTLIHKLGSGVSQGLGTGGRDLSAEVGGIMMSLGLEALENDPNTKAIVLISKPPAPETAERILRSIRDCSKPVVICFVGAASAAVGAPNAITAQSLEDAAEEAVHRAEHGGMKRPRGSSHFALPPARIESLVQQETDGMTPAQCCVRGLFSGGTLCSEALFLLEDFLGHGVYSNVSQSEEWRLPNSYESQGECCVDLGEEEFTKGRLHPMIDPTIRKLRILHEARDASVAAIMLDVVIGYGSHPDMAEQLAPAIVEAKAAASADGRRLSVLAEVVGTDLDPQNAKWQANQLKKAGAVVMASNCQMARLAALIAGRSDPSVAERVGRERSAE